MSRKGLAAAYTAAVAARRGLESTAVDSPEFDAAYEAACSAERAACAALVAAEMAEPTRRETRREDNNLYWRNRGYD